MTQAAILLVDVETFPNLARVWGIHKQHVLEVIENISLASYSAKWLDGEHVTKALCDVNRKGATNDKALVQGLWSLLDRADVVIAHFGDGFDLPVIRARFAAYNMLPPSTFKSIDTKRVASRLFHFGGSYSLDHICQYLGIGEKLPTGGYDLWKQCMAGDAAAWKRMKEYNAHDVTLLEKLYFRLRPWITDHPSVARGPLCCPKCGSPRLQSRGTARTSTRSYKRFQCQECGGWCRSTASDTRQAVTNA